VQVRVYHVTRQGRTGETDYFFPGVIENIHPTSLADPAARRGLIHIIHWHQYGVNFF